MTYELATIYLIAEIWALWFLLELHRKWILPRPKTLEM